MFSKKTGPLGHTKPLRNWLKIGQEWQIVNNLFSDTNFQTIDYFKNTFIDSQFA